MRTGDLKPDNESKPKSIRFGIVHLLYGTALVASGLVVLGIDSFFVSGSVVAVWFALSFCKDRPTLIECLVTIAIIGILVGMLLPTVQVFRDTPPRAVDLNNLRQLILAMHNYESSHGHMPSAIESDAQGTPMHSWRVRLLPFLDCDVLYHQYRFDEPWNGPNNTKLSDQMPDVFRSYVSPQADGETTFRVVSDREAFFYGDRKPYLDQVKDGTSNTLGVVQVPDQPVNWLKPDTLNMQAVVSSFCGLEKVAYRNESYFKTTYFGHAACTLDGRGFMISPEIEPSDLKAMLTANGGEVIEDESFQVLVVHKPHAYFALVCYRPCWLYRSGTCTDRCLRGHAFKLPSPSQTECLRPPTL